MFEVKNVPAADGTEDKSSKEADENAAAGAVAEIAPSKAPSIKSESFDSKHKIVPENMDTVKNLLEEKRSRE